MNEWALTDAEIASAWNCDLRVQHLLFSGKRAEDVREGDRAIATAAQKKLVEWLERETAPHDPNHYWMGARRILRDETLAALREAAREGK